MTPYWFKKPRRRVPNGRVTKPRRVTIKQRAPGPVPYGLVPYPGKLKPIKRILKRKRKPTERRTTVSKVILYL